jgi:hypothetical protein
MKKIELFKRELSKEDTSSGTREATPPNANKILDIINRVDEVEMKANKLLVKLTFENIAEIITNAGLLDQYDKEVRSVVDELYMYEDVFRSEKNKVEDAGDSYDNFFYALDNTQHEIFNVTEITDTISSIISAGENIREANGEEILEKANQVTTINEFKRFS